MQYNRKPIDVIAAHYCNNRFPIPIKFRTENQDGESKTLKILSIRSKDIDNFAGNTMIKYICDINLNDIICSIELRYELSSCTWFLYFAEQRTSL